VCHAPVPRPYRWRVRAVDLAVYADALSLRALEFAYGYPKQTAWRELATAESPEEIPAGSLVLINPAHIEWLCAGLLAEGLRLKTES